MAFHYENLDERTRQLMLAEFGMDSAQGLLYLSPRLSESGLQDYAGLLEQAIRWYEGDWLAAELRQRGCLKAYEERRTARGGLTTVKLPLSAAETLAEGEFNRFYIRGVCARAIEAGLTEVEVYRGKPVSKPRPESEAVLGRRVSAQALLDTLRRSHGLDPALGLPPGPNSGLSVRLPQP